MCFYCKLVEENGVYSEQIRGGWLTLHRDLGVREERHARVSASAGQVIAARYDEAQEGGAPGGDRLDPDVRH